MLGNNRMVGNSNNTNFVEPPCNFSPLSEIFALVLCTAGGDLVL